jgi:hypothetical protein
MAAGDRDGDPDLERIRQLASELAAVDGGPAGELACALADAVLGIADRVDALWQLIAAVVNAAGPTTAAGDAPPPPEFLQAMTSARSSGPRGVWLNIAGQDWAAAISSGTRPADPADAWAALGRVARSAGLGADQGGR